MNTTFLRDLKQSIKTRVRELRADGTTGMSMANLRAVTRPPPDGPKGTNAQWIYAELFAQAAKDGAKGFVY